MNKLLTFIKQKWLWILGFAFTWAVPIYMLNEISALAENVPAHIKVTFTGSTVILVLFFAFRKWLYGKIITMKIGLVRALLMTLYRAVAYGLVFGLLWGIVAISDNLLDYWQSVGISLVFGAICYCLYEYFERKRLDTII